MSAALLFKAGLGRGISGSVSRHRESRFFRARCQSSCWAGGCTERPHREGSRVTDASRHGMDRCRLVHDWGNKPGKPFLLSCIMNIFSVRVRSFHASSITSRRSGAGTGSGLRPSARTTATAPSLPGRRKDPRCARSRGRAGLNPKGYAASQARHNTHLGTHSGRLVLL